MSNIEARAGRMSDLSTPTPAAKHIENKLDAHQEIEDLFGWRHFDIRQAAAVISALSNTSTESVRSQLLGEAQPPTLINQTASNVKEKFLRALTLIVPDDTERLTMQDKIRVYNLKPVEYSIIALLAQGMSQSQLADQLKIKANTTKTRIAAIKDAVIPETTDRTQIKLARHAITEGLLPLSLFSKLSLAQHTYLIGYLNPTQAAILEQLALGLTNQQIADELAYSKGRIGNVTTDIYATLNCRGRLEAALIDLFRQITPTDAQPTNHTFPSHLKDRQLWYQFGWTGINFHHTAVIISALADTPLPETISYIAHLLELLDGQHQTSDLDPNSKNYIPPSLFTDLFGHYFPPDSQNPLEAAHQIKILKLTPAEYLQLIFISKGLTNQQIADLTSIHPGTAGNTQSSLYKKIASINGRPMVNRALAAAYAVSEEIVPLKPHRGIETT